MNNKFLSIAASTAIVASALVFSGCGDSSSSSTTAAAGSSTGNTGTLSGTAVKGPWSNLTYVVTANGTLANTSGTMTGGAFTFSTTSDNVTIDLGMAKWKIVNPTSGSMFSFLNVAQEGNKLLRTNGTEYSSTDYSNVIDNLLLTTLAFENDTSALESTTTPYNAGSLIANFAKLAATGLDLTQNSATFQTSLALNLTAANLTSVNKTSVATAATAMNAYKTAIRSAYGTALATAYNSLNSLNSTKLNNTFVIVSNSTGKYVIDLTNTWANGAAGVSAKGNVTTVSDNGLLTAMNDGSPVNASGSIIKFGSANVTNLSTDYAVFTSSLSGLRTGSTVKMRYVNSAGEMKEYTVNAIRTNLSTWSTGGNSFKGLNLTLTDSYGNPKLQINSTAPVVDTTTALSGINLTAAKYVASTNTWTYINTTGKNCSVRLGNESDMSGLNTTLRLYNQSNGTATEADSYMNLTFDFDAAGYQNGGNSTYANGGVIATIVNTVDTALLAIAKFFVSIFTRVG